MSLVYSVDSVTQLDKYLDNDHNYTHQGLYKIVEYYNNLETDTNLYDVCIRTTFVEYELDELFIEYDIPDFIQEYQDCSQHEYIIDWLKENVPNIQDVWFLPFPETFMIKLNDV
jgi:hypothetical protein